MFYKLVVPGPIEDVEEVRVLEWHGECGRQFSPGELIVELETHKALVEVRAAQPGVLRKIECEAGGWRRVGESLALLSSEPDEQMPSPGTGMSTLLVEFDVS